jgi:outer membrane protein
MTRQTRRLPIATLVAVLGAALASPAALSQEVNIVKAGLIRYDTHSKTSGIKGIGIPPGADATTGDATTLILVYERLLTPNIGVELVLGIPPRLKANAAGSVAFLGDDILSAKNVAPTVIANYHFGNAGDTLRPYVGVGVNYTRFTGIRSSLAPKVEMSDSVGLVVQAGANYMLARDWGLFASIAKVQVKTDLVATASTVLTTTIDFRPITYSFGVANRF